MQNTYQDLITAVQNKNPAISPKLEGGKKFQMKTDFKPAGDQPEAIKQLVNGANKEEFNQKFRGNPAKRPKRRGLLRNVAIALGNSGDELSVPALILALRDEEPLIRSHAAWGLGQLGGDSAHHALLEQREHESDIGVLEEIDLALTNFAKMNNFPKTSFNE